MTVSAAALRPLSLPELLDQAVRLYRKNFLTFVGIIAVVQIPLQIISLLVSFITFSGVPALGGSRPAGSDPFVTPRASPFAALGPGYFIGLFLSLLVTLVYLILVNGFATAAITRAIADSYLGQPVGILKSYRQVGRVGFRLVGALLLASLLGIALFIWFIVPCIGWLSGLGILAFFGGAVVPLIAPAIVIENQSAGGAIRRAWDLSRRRFWWVVGFIAILFVFAQIVISGPTTLVTFILQAVFGNPAFSPNPGQAFAVETTISSLVGLVFALVYVPFQLVNITMMYFDLRIRTEGLDLALQADASANTEQTNVPTLFTSAPAPASGNLITGSEFGYFVVLTIGVGIAYVALTFIFGILGLAILGASGGFPGRP